jgi:protein-S-isoprenylcysteine O-methyltransferase Ste14
VVGLLAAHHATPKGHTDFYVAAAATFPVLALALVLNTRFPRMFQSTWPAYAFGSLFLLPAVAGWAAAIAALESGRDTHLGRIVVCLGLGGVVYLLFGSVLTSRFIGSAGRESWPSLIGALALGLVLLGGSALVGAWAIGAV